MRYLSKFTMNEWMRERGYVEAAVKITAARSGERQAPKRQSPRTGSSRGLIQTVFHALKTMQDRTFHRSRSFEEKPSHRHYL